MARWYVKLNVETLLSIQHHSSHYNGTPNHSIEHKPEWNECHALVEMIFSTSSRLSNMNNLIKRSFESVAIILTSHTHKLGEHWKMAHVTFDPMGMNWSIHGVTGGIRNSQRSNKISLKFGIRNSKWDLEVFHFVSHIFIKLSKSVQCTNTWVVCMVIKDSLSYLQ